MPAIAGRRTDALIAVTEYALTNLRARCPVDSAESQRVDRPGIHRNGLPRLRDGDLSRLRTERVVFTECDFSGVNLAESQHRGSAFRNCTFRRTSLWHSTFAHCSMLGSVFTSAGCGR